MKTASYYRGYLRRGSLTSAFAIAATAALADDVTGKDSLVCTAWQAISCSTATSCETTEAWELNLPDFVKVDLEAQTIGTFEGAAEDRATEIASVLRQDGKVFLNGIQEDRGFTWVINEETGEGTLAIATDTTVISVFTACAATDNIR